MSYRDVSARVYVGNLPENCRESEVERLFSKVGAPGGAGSRAWARA